MWNFGGHCFRPWKPDFFRSKVTFFISHIIFWVASLRKAITVSKYRIIKASTFLFFPDLSTFQHAYLLVPQFAQWAREIEKLRNNANLRACKIVSLGFTITSKQTKRTEKYPFPPISHSTRLLAATTLRNVLGTKVQKLILCSIRFRLLPRLIKFFVAQNLAEILSERESIAQVMQVSELP